ncbi:hypothetical protein ACFFX0_20310 [Citricoccus parietis]|uniref:Uncharacterized protein n=1 Tax=Citricoccus parietis TaxID=592307 RepID=A0ABV5G436_9MICC
MARPIRSSVCWDGTCLSESRRAPSKCRRLQSAAPEWRSPGLLSPLGRRCSGLPPWSCWRRTPGRPCRSTPAFRSRRRSSGVSCGPR